MKNGPHADRPGTRACRRLLATGAAVSLGVALLAGAPTTQAADLPAAAADVFDLNEATIAEITAALESGTLTSVELTAMYLNRIAAYDHGGITLNSRGRAQRGRAGRGGPDGPAPSRGQGPRPAARHPVHGQGQLQGQGPDRGLRLSGVQEPGGGRGRVLRGCDPGLGRPADRQDEHAADRQRRHAARGLRPCGEPVQRALPHRGLGLRLLQRLRDVDRGQLRGVRDGRGDGLLGPLPGLQQRPDRLHPLARAHLDPGQRTPVADPRRRRAAHPHRRGHPDRPGRAGPRGHLAGRRLLAHPAVRRPARRRGRAPRVLPRPQGHRARWRASGSAYRGSTSTRTPRPRPRSRPASR